MSTGDQAEKPDADGLQFEHADFAREAPAALACVACQRPIADRYYEIRGSILCEPCRTGLEGRLGGGAFPVRFVRAGGLGVAGAFAGGAIYAAFMYFSPIDLSLIAILVGYLVGKGVRKGSGGLGGLPFQVLAVALTYCGLALTYIALGLVHHWKAEPDVPLDGAKLLQYVVIGFISPVVRMKFSPIQIVFVGFALWEAWKFNRRLKLVVTGPYQVGEPGVEASR